MTHRLHIPAGFKKPRGYYVYTIKVNGIVRYVGAGSGWRAWDHKRRSSNVAKIRAAVEHAAQIDVLIIARGFKTQRAAFAREEQIILSFPKKQLWNRERSRGDFISAVWSDPVKREAMNIARNAVMQTPEYRENLSRGKKLAFKRFASVRQALEAGRTPEARKKQGRAYAKRWRDPEFRARMRIIQLAAWKKRMKTFWAER